MHRLLQRQLKRHRGEPGAATADWQALLEAISAYYVEIDRERDLLQNSLMVSSAELTEANERLRLRNQEFMQTMLNTLSEGILAVDAAGKIIFMNRSAERMLGMTEKESIEKMVADFIHHSCADETGHAAEDCALLDAIAKGTPGSGDEYLTHRDKRTIPVSYQLNPFKHDDIVKGSLISFQDITDRLKSEETIYQLAFFDPLTGLPNRRLLLDRLEHAMAASSREQRHGAVLFIDIDHFKVINDTLGHECGDLMLKEIGQRLKSVLRGEDTVARLGGDEFIVILEKLDGDRSHAAAHAKITADKILEAIRLPLYLKGNECVRSASLGIVMFRGHDEHLNEILKRSDLAMYDAKKIGRNTVRFFDPLMQQELEGRSRLENDLRLALADNQFKLFYQKRVDDSGAVKGAEALLRWLQPERGLVSPMEFIPLAEEVGLIVPIGNWVLNEACRQLKAWERHPSTSRLMVSVNVSTREFNQDDFVERVHKIVRDSAINPAALELEITESMLLDNVDLFINKMEKLSKLGITFSLDDFGTGYSSLSYLKKLPIHKLKIDKSFIRDLEYDKNDEAIVETVIQIGRTLGLEVIAEGVETPAQQILLVRHGCCNFQGYLFGKPEPAEIFERELRAEAIPRSIAGKS